MPNLSIDTVAVKTSLPVETVLVVETLPVAETSLAQTAENSLTQAAETSAAPENPENLKAAKPTTQKAQEDQKSVTPKSVTPKLKREILHRDQCCQFKDTDTGRVCGAKLFLEVDHIRPRFARGENTAENLRTLRKNHNMFRYQQGL